MEERTSLVCNKFQISDFESLVRIAFAPLKQGKYQRGITSVQLRRDRSGLLFNFLLF